MKVFKGEKLICSNPTCRAEFVVSVSSGPAEGGNPRCCCGSEMKKVYAAPTLWEVQDQKDSKGFGRDHLSKVR
jgi:hypothetical protein